MTAKHKSSATMIPIEKAVGHVLAHDITEIRPGQFKGPAFKKGHIVQHEDLDHLRRIGKEHLFVLHIGPHEIHEDEAALMRRKLQCFGCHLKETILCPDDKREIVRAIRVIPEKGCRLILVAGGMSVDPDDVSRMAIAEAGTRDIVYGTPVLPGAMFLYGRFRDIPVLGLPACILYYRATVFDLLFPRVLAGEIITRRDLALMAHGGLCLNCEQYKYPVCPFGK